MIADWRLAEALEIQRLHGAEAPVWTAGRLLALAAEGDRDGVERFAAIAERLDELLSAARRPC